MKLVVQLLNKIGLTLFNALRGSLKKSQKSELGLSNEEKRKVRKRCLEKHFLNQFNQYKWAKIRCGVKFLLIVKMINQTLKAKMMKVNFSEYTGKL